ncbi:MAG: hypothetical protein ACI8ZN_002392, partial [Bacteroidia bacterium]
NERQKYTINACLLSQHHQVMPCRTYFVIAAVE